MRVFAIGDLHLDSTRKKPMDIFGQNWIGHEQKIFDNWRENVLDDDMVLIPGDISWAIKLEEANIDLKMIDDMPGKKVCIRGNHDYWWTTKNKLNRLKLDTIEFISNDCFIYNGIAICGCRGWDTYDIESNKDSERIFKRELLRFEMSLQLTKNVECKKIALLHFPPFNIDKSPNDFVNIMQKYSIDTCIYGHLHGAEGHKLAKEGIINGINFYCVASDYLDFKLKLIKV
ncbi:metallophosphoesterase [Sedimentibacter sp. zth1]|uniref:metallophosphoesterase n=1 Tax=Sedimentibacter sp. zth1 TaxID=2816908 RepID=UPI001A91E2FA|nr:metallophosphoesterase [Sedimentibacter sp. zth1]QSX04895.1 metallophosphoesterase [Sedimentibacter sp. zth1]